jgi:hypothetical protein
VATKWKAGVCSVGEREEHGKFPVVAFMMGTMSWGHSPAGLVEEAAWAQ